MFAAGLTGFLVTLASLVVWAFFGSTSTPWILLVALLGSAAILAASLFRKRSRARLAAAGAASAVALGTWYVLLVLLAFPDYGGPVRAGIDAPPFTAHTAAGTPLDHRSLGTGQATLLVFYRGLW